MLPSLIHTRAIEKSEKQKTTRARAEAGFERGFVGRHPSTRVTRHAATTSRVPRRSPRRRPPRRRIRIVASFDDGSHSFARVARRGAALRARAASPRATTNGEERKPTLATTRRFGFGARRRLLLETTTTPAPSPIPSTTDHARLRVRRTNRYRSRFIVERHMDREGRFVSPRSSAAGSVASRSSSREPSEAGGG